MYIYGDTCIGMCFFDDTWKVIYMYINGDASTDMYIIGETCKVIYEYCTFMYIYGDPCTFCYHTCTVMNYHFVHNDAVHSDADMTSTATQSMTHDVTECKRL